MPIKTKVLYLFLTKHWLIEFEIWTEGVKTAERAGQRIQDTWNKLFENKMNITDEYGKWMMK